MDHAETASVKRKIRRAAGLKKVKTIIQMVREFLPASGTRLGNFCFYPRMRFGEEHWTMVSLLPLWRKTGGRTAECF